MKEQSEYYIADDNGDKIWYLPSEGKNYHHREDGPAIECVNGDKVWIQNGKRHREDGPAVERADGSWEWWLKGTFHCESGPAIKSVNGILEWHVNGKLHRKDGPAVQWPGGYTEWWIDGKQLVTKEIEDWLEENDVDLSTDEGQTAFILRWA